jgi:hypothetical protein
MTEQTMTITPTGKTESVGGVFYRFRGFVQVIGQPPSEPRWFSISMPTKDRRVARRVCRRFGQRFSVGREGYLVFRSGPKP